MLALQSNHAASMTNMMIGRITPMLHENDMPLASMHLLPRETVGSAPLDWTASG
jgi:hypothetical protein